MKNSIFHSIIYILSSLTAAIAAGCSDAEGPTNLEPEISVTPATDLSRTEATLAAQITTKGTGRLSYLRFRYGETEEMASVSENLNADSDNVSIRIDNLKPGTTYYYCAEGGSHQALIRSQMLSFTTVPNTSPSVSDAKALSSGPIGLIVGFSILDDGGEPVMEAGCEVRNSVTGEVFTHTLPAGSLSIGKQTLYIKISPNGSQYSITPFATNSIGKATGAPVLFTPGNAVILESAGLLSTLLGEADTTFDCLPIAGPMNGDDFRFLRRILRAPLLQGESETGCSASSLDLSDAVIVEGGNSYDGSRFTVANTISTGLFANCRLLADIKLPSGATSLQRDAFSGCTRLKTLTIPANIADLQTSSGCEALEEIKMSEANPYFKSLDGVLFDIRLTDILWFPQAKEGHYDVPASVSNIRENAFSGSRISSISFPDGITSIGRGALSSTMLREVTLPESLANIPEALLQNSTLLSCVRIGSQAAYVGSYSFAGCSPADIYIKASLPPVVAENAFGQSPAPLFEGCTLHVPQGAGAAYKKHSEWGKFVNITED